MKGARYSYRSLRGIPVSAFAVLTPLPLLETQGYFRVGGYAEFHSCDNQGGGESPPGRGGAIFNAANGSILFEGGVLIEDTFITVRDRIGLTSATFAQR